MNLFICTTPLQSIIAKNIIELETLHKNSVEIFYECKRDNIDKITPFFNTLSEMACRATLNYDDLFFLQYVDFYKNKFKDKVYKNIYLSSINNVHFHFILSFVKFEKLITFDDGTANIIEGSIFRRLKKSSILKKILYIAFGNNFTMDKVKKASDFHYTIYPGFENIHTRTVSIDIFHFPLQDEVKKYSCHLILGTVFDEVSSMPNDAAYIEAKTDILINKLNNSGEDVYYLPHPRQNGRLLNDAFLLSNSTIAEQHVINMLSKYRNVNIYGFASSAQFNILGAGNKVKNYVLFSKKLKPIFCDLEEMLISAGAVELDID